MEGKFKKGDKVILVRDLVTHPKFSLRVRLCSGQVFKVTEVPKKKDYPTADDLGSWVRVNGIDPQTGKKYTFDMAIDVVDLIPCTDIGELIYGS